MKKGSRHLQAWKDELNFFFSFKKCVKLLFSDQLNAEMIQAWKQKLINQDGQHCQFSFGLHTEKCYSRTF